MWRCQSEADAEELVANANAIAQDATSVYWASFSDDVCSGANIGPVASRVPPLDTSVHARV